MSAGPRPMALLTYEKMLDPTNKIDVQWKFWTYMEIYSIIVHCSRGKNSKNLDKTTARIIKELLSCHLLRGVERPLTNTADWVYYTNDPRDIVRARKAQCK